jgi:hypothetical protein
MVRFIETVNFNPDFAKRVYSLFYDPEKGKCNLCSRRKFKSIKGWPEGLDLENLEIVSIGPDHITYWAGGDWQEGATVNLQLDTNGKRLKFIPFEFYSKKSPIEIKNAIADLNEQGQALMESSRQEDCQTAGPMMGDLPQNSNGILSPGYKNGRVLPLPKKKTKSQDYNSIPYF